MHVAIVRCKPRTRIAGMSAEPTPAVPATRPAPSSLPTAPARRRLTDEQFQGLAVVPAEAEWFANITNPATRRAYQADVADFSRFVGIDRPEDFRAVTRPHVIAWRKELEGRGLAAATIRRKLAALSSLYGHLTENNAVTNNPVDGVKRPGEGANEGKTPAIGDGQARRLLDAPDAGTVKGKRDRAILAVFLFHGVRRDELCRLRVRDVEERRGVKYLRVHGKGDKIRFIPAHPTALERVADYLDAAGHGADAGGPLFRPVKNPGGTLEKPLSGDAVYARIVKQYAKAAGIEQIGVCVHSLRATAVTNALDHQADIAQVQAWCGHSSIATTKLYDRRQSRAEDSPTFKVAY